MENGFWEWVAWGLGAYFVGGFPTGVVFTRNKFGIDVREMGSGNIGATNVTRTFGWTAGLAVFLVDYIKGLVPLLAIMKYFPDRPLLVPIVGTALVIGHCFSPYLRFRGGKGVATSVGCLSAVLPYAALIGGAVYVAALAIFRISAVGSLFGVVSVLTYIWLVPPPTTVLALVYGFSFIVLIRHHSNIRRLIWGKTSL